MSVEFAEFGEFGWLTGSQASSCGIDLACFFGQPERQQSALCSSVSDFGGLSTGSYFAVFTQPRVDIERRSVDPAGTGGQIFFSLRIEREMPGRIERKGSARQTVSFTVIS